MPAAGEDDGMFYAALRLLSRSWKQIDYRYSGLTPQEREVITPELHARMVIAMTGMPLDTGEPRFASKLTDRAVSYAENAVDGFELSAECSVADMERVTGKIASGFVVGYGACLDDHRFPPRRGRK